MVPDPVNPNFPQEWTREHPTRGGPGQVWSWLLDVDSGGTGPLTHSHLGLGQIVVIVACELLEMLTIYPQMTLAGC